MNGPHQDFHAEIAGTYRAWVGGDITEEAAMEAIGQALTELRERTGLDAQPMPARSQTHASALRRLRREVGLPSEKETVR